MQFLLRIVGVASSTYYDRQHTTEGKHIPNPKGRPLTEYCFDTNGNRVCEEQIKEWIMEFRLGFEAAYGYRKMTQVLRKQKGLLVNKKRIYRLFEELDILQPARPTVVHYPRRLVRNRIITASNQLWETDIKYMYIEGEDRFCFLMGLIDVFDRGLIEYHIGLSCQGVDAFKLLERGLWKRGLHRESDDLPVIRTDNGPQFIAGVFQKGCLDLGVEHERIPPKTPNLNAHIESFHAQIERELLARHTLTSYKEAYEMVSDYIHFYCHDRIHGSIFDMAPMEFYAATQAGLIIGKEVRL